MVPEKVILLATPVAPSHAYFGGYLLSLWVGDAELGAVIGVEW